MTTKTVALVASPGNTMEMPKRVKSTSRRWCFTLNNYTEEELNQISDIFEKKNWNYVMGLEIGEEKKTPHIQGYFESKNCVRFSTVKKILPKAHIEACKGTRQQNTDYCTKDMNYRTNMKIKKPIRQILYEKYYANVIWRPWQEEVLAILAEEPHPRQINWIVDKKGNSGKSFLVKYLAIKYDVIIANGKGNDVLHAIAKYDEKIGLSRLPVIICDLPRHNADYINYGTIEMIKNGLVYSGKYEGAQLLFDIPHVFVFANSFPEEGKWSIDRYNVIDIRDLCDSPALDESESPSSQFQLDESAWK